MKKKIISVDTQHALLSKKSPPVHLSLQKKINTLAIQLQEAQTQHYQTPYAALNLPFDTYFHATIVRVAQQKKQLCPTMMVIIGIGGSNLGTQAVHQACRDTLCTQESDALKIYYADTIDPVASTQLYALVEKTLQHKQIVLLVVISKSGTTLETLAHFYTLSKMLQHYHPKTYQEHVVAITDRHSALWKYAAKHQMDAFEIPSKVGGRFSVLSAVGIFPLAMMGIDTKELLEGAQSITDALVRDDNDNIALTSALTIYKQYQQRITIQDMFVFAPQLQGFALWYRQLLAESIGKKTDEHGTIVHCGITPTVSIGTTDLHSVGQLYIAGPYDKCCTFVTVEKFLQDTQMPNEPSNLLFSVLHNQTLSALLQATIAGVFAAYRDEQRPYVHLTVPELTPYYLGQLFQYKIVEIWFLAALLNINAFDQPGVDTYKSYTRQFLSK